MKAFFYTAAGVVGALVGLYLIGRAVTGNAAPSEAAAADETAAPQKADPEPEPVPSAPPATGDNVIPFDDAAQSNADEARFQASGTAAADAPETHKTVRKEQCVKMKIAQGNDPIVGSVEQYYMTLVKAIHDKKIQGEIWRGEGELPKASVIELRGRTIDLMTALRTPHIYYDASGEGISLAYQYTTRKNPMLFVQVDGYIYVLAGDESRFLSSVPNPEELTCDPNGYLNVVLSCLIEKLGLDESLPQG